MPLPHSHILHAVLTQIQTQLPAAQRGVLARFVEHQYQSISEDELMEQGVMALQGAILSQWHLLQVRKPQAINCRVYNPTLERHGWHSPHTVIELCQQDRPFLVDSLTVKLERLGMGVHFIVHSGCLAVERDKNGQLLQVLEGEARCETDAVVESVIFVEIDHQADHNHALQRLQQAILTVMHDVTLATDDYQPMLTALEQDIATLAAKSSNLPPALQEETLAFLKWLAGGSFTFLGQMQLQVKAGQSAALQVVPGTGLGLFKDAAWLKAVCEADGVACGQTLANKAAVLIAKSNLEATVHRGGQLDVIALRQFHNGEVVGESRYVGLYTSGAYHDSVQRIPLLRHKVAEVITRSGYSLKGHDGKTLLNVLDTFPRDELFQIEIDELFTTSIRMMQAMERQRVRLFVRKEPAGRYYYCMVFVPKEVYSTELCVKIQALLQQAFAGQSAAFTPHFLEAPLCRVDYLVRLPEKVQAEAVDLVALEQAVALLAKNWPDQLKQALLATYGEQQGAALYFKYHRAFAAGYREDYMGQQVVTDINHIERVQSDPHGLSLYFYQGAVAEANEARLKVFRLGGGLPLTTVLPILENMGLKVLEERPYQVAVDAKQFVWISDFKLQLHNAFDPERIEPIFKEAFMRIWLGQAESDGFNRLIVMSGLSWREVLILRAIAKYWLQIGCRYSQSYIENALTDNPDLARLLIQLFEVRFNPATGAEIGARRAQADAVIVQLQTKLQSVSNLDQDRIINGYLSIIAAIVRTNYFQLDANNQAKEYLSFKIESARIPNLPKPVPMFEVFVFSRAVEAIHLRMAKVARGGLRWSDRLEDFRTEVLGLMKAQQVKNAVIVPMGAKGGFVVKNPMPGASRDELLQNGIACYRTFIRGLLDITDNVYAGKVVAPVQVVRYDEDDIYLVVAADKGTATFSDIANEVASEYRFWLGDAFASGGRFGYDHKKMAITARGAWEAVKRSFLSFGHNTQTQPFTVVGIGDMSGDVFGNGMLLSEQIRLVGAFNHMHIFIDPNPDAAVSFQERKRLFHLPRSTWKDYNADLLSAGGAIYERQAKWITLSPEAKQRFGIDKDKVEPNELIQALLRAEVDLLWNGGIGTYIKASTETHFDVGDRQNDGLRIDATEIRAKVVGEGGNLGVTQRGRIEFALRGGLINTDAIDNSAGVDCSDHEVNIKILLNDLLAAKKLTVAERNQLLSEMVDDVAHLVLKNNYDQTQTIVNGLIDDSGSNSIFNRLIGELVREAGLDRKVEGIPSDRELDARRVAGQGLTAPELAVLMAYSKAIIRRTILGSTLPEDPYFFKYLAAEFPPVLAERYPDAMKQHRLARDIIATQVTNVMVKYMGVGFVHRMYDQTGATTQMIVRAFEVMSQLFCVPAIWRHIEKLDGKVPAKVQYELMHIVRRAIRRFSRWLLRHSRENCDVETYLAILSPTLTRLRALQAHVLPEHILMARVQAVEKYYHHGVPKSLAQQVVNLDAISPVFDIIEVALNEAIDIETVALMYAQVGERLSLGWLRTSLIEYSGKDDYWEMLTGSALRDDLDQYQSLLTRSVLVSTPDTIGAAERVTLWSAQHRVLVDRWQFLFEDFRISKPDLLKLTIALRALADLVDTVRLRQGLTAYPRLNSQGEFKKGA